jgi:hypothetical protein
MFAEFVESLAADRGHRVCNIPGFVFLCGGTEPAGSTVVSVVRPAFQRYVLENRPKLKPHIILAEDLVDGYADVGQFQDLLHLEERLAELAATILVFAESSGSIAELGAFAAIESIGKKTIAVVERRYSDAHSFINDGPLRRLSPPRVYIYDWLDEKHPPEVMEGRFQEHCLDLAGALEERLASHEKSQALDLSHSGHAMLLMADAARLFRVLLLSDFRELVKALGQEIDDRTILQHLFVLEKLKLIRRISYSNQHWFTSENCFIEYKRKEGGSIDSVRFAAQNSLNLKFDPGTKRARAYRSYLEAERQAVTTEGGFTFALNDGGGLAHSTK